MKSNPNFELVIGKDSQVVTLGPPFSIDLDVLKSDGYGLNKAVIKISGLGDKTRNRLVKDEEEDKYIPVRLSMGWGKKLGLVFKGSVNIGTNRREGPIYLTTLTALDGGYDYLNSYTSRTIEADTNPVEQLLDDMPNTDVGKITPQVKLYRPKVLVGSTTKLIEDSLASDERFYIENEQLYVIKNDEVIRSYIPTVSAQTGLLNTPQRRAGQVTFDMLYSPEIILGGRFKLESKGAPQLNDTYKVVAINFKGQYKNTGASTWNMSVTAFTTDNFKVL